MRVASVIIADDHEVARLGLRGMLAGEAYLEVVAEASNGLEAVDLCRRRKPDLAILDVRMPRIDGIAATQAIRQITPATHVLIVSLHDAPELVIAAAEAGAAGYVLKDTSRRDLVAVVRQILRGELHLTGDLITRMRRQVHQQALESGSTEQLTPRELEVLRLLTTGQTNREIGSLLGISAGTVKSHVERVIAKLAVSSRTEAAVYALRFGLVDTN
ncbi:MAG TPA: response regulator transcription factor [Roseiflexaceae bacterium]|nr:response regulator transcription factor [Roseiflexaceae bacterium]